MTDWLLGTLLATSGLIVLVLMIREPVRRNFGARVTYGLWLIPAARLLMPTLTQTIERPVGAAVTPQMFSSQTMAEPLLLSSVAQAFRHIHPAMKEWEIPQIPEWGEANKPKAVEFLKLLDTELADREFAAGDSYSIADITGLIAIDFMKPARIKVPEDCTNVLRWHGAISSRPSAAA